MTYWLAIILVFAISCSFPAALINAIRAEDPEKAERRKVWACISFGLSTLFVFLGTGIL
nr:hypothetical protein [uncultured Oscillibacter sp.]